MNTFDSDFKIWKLTGSRSNRRQQGLREATRAKNMHFGNQGRPRLLMNKYMFQ